MTMMMFLKIHEGMVHVYCGDLLKDVYCDAQTEFFASSPAVSVIKSAKGLLKGLTYFRHVTQQKLSAFCDRGCPTTERE